MPKPADRESDEAKADTAAAGAPRRVGIDDLPDLLRDVRYKRNLTLKEVESQTGLSVSTLSRIENGISRPSGENYMKLLAWLELEPDLAPDAATRFIDTMTEIGILLKRDPRLSKGAADRLLRAWRPMYDVYANAPEDD